jgi:hypothetical protein
MVLRNLHILVKLKARRMVIHLTDMPWCAEQYEFGA